MRKVVLKMHISLDGFVGSEDGDVQWLFPHFEEEMEKWEVERLWRADVHVMGKSLYEDMAEYWPQASEPPAAPMNEIPKVVFSRSLERADWGESRIERGPLAAGIAALAREEGNGSDPDKEVLVHGGASFAQSVSHEGLINEYRLLVHPLTLGAGLRPFADPVDLALVETRRFPAGVVALTYRRG